MSVSSSTLTEAVIGSPSAPVVVLFGGNPYRRHEVVNQLATLGDITVYGTLSEAEGFERLKAQNGRVSLVLIGGRYDADQRARIKAWVAAHLPGVPVSQPGYDYPYANEAILADIRRKTGL